MNIDKYKLSGSPGQCPVRPYPKPDRNAKAKEYREYADKLDKFDKDMEEFNRMIAERKRKFHELEDAFKKDALEELGLSNHPHADRIYAFAWENGHSSGLQEVWSCLQELKNLLEDIEVINDPITKDIVVC